MLSFLQFSSIYSQMSTEAISPDNRNRNNAFFLLVTLNLTKDSVNLLGYHLKRGRWGTHHKKLKCSETEQAPDAYPGRDLQSRFQVSICDHEVILSTNNFLKRLMLVISNGVTDTRLKPLRG